MAVARMSKDNVNFMNNKLMEGVYTREFMTEHSLTGKPLRLPRAAQQQRQPEDSPKVKPGLPMDDFQAITRTN